MPDRPLARRLTDPLEVVRKLPGQVGFQVLPRRWVVERTFGWLIRWRRLVRDYEVRMDVSDAMIHVSMGRSCSAVPHTQTRSHSQTGT